MKFKIIFILAGSMIFHLSAKTEQKTDVMKQENRVENNSKKRILARGCDPVASFEFSKIVPPLIGNAQYIPTTEDVDFFEKLKKEKWSVIYFAPGACRFSASGRRIPGTNDTTKTWTLAEYKELIYQLQGSQIQIVESMDESQGITLLRNALNKAIEVK